ncbi:MAG: tyrosine-protein phosphatase, partial [Myxococcota bacterium]
MATARPDGSARGLLNFRSLPLPPGAQTTLYRSGDLTALTAETARYLSQGLGISTCVDLRTGEEIRAGGPPAALCAAGVRWVQSPINGPARSAIAKPRPGPDAYVRYYLEMLAASWLDFQKALLAVLRHGRAPLVFGCFAGKD